MMDDKYGELVLYAVNDHQKPLTVQFKVTDVDTGEIISAGTSIVGADVSYALQTIRDDGKIHFYAIEWETSDGEKGINTYLQGKPRYDFDWYMNCLKKLKLDEFEGF